MGGHVPPRILLQPLSPDPALWPDWYIDELREHLRWRASRFASRRRSAHAAAVQLIRHHEAVLWPEEIGE